MLHPAQPDEWSLDDKFLSLDLCSLNKLPDKQQDSFGAILVFCPARGPKESIALSIAEKPQSNIL